MKLRASSVCLLLAALSAGSFAIAYSKVAEKARAEQTYEAHPASRVS
jgi:hypothetical protein